MDREPIAIVGIGCRLPGASSPEAFWRLLRDGVDAVGDVPASRWDKDRFYDPDPGTPGKMNSRKGGFLEQIDQFDPQFFGISPRETTNMDPQQRLLLEVAWEALEDAGQPPLALGGTATGVFMGVSSFDYYELLAADPRNFDAYTGTGSLSAVKANRISYFLGLTGPSMAVDSACSSSLLAVHLACQSLWSGESKLALVGGVHVLLSPGMSVGYSKGGFMAPDGRCKTFDALADGYVRGEGAGIVVLKKASLAEAQGDRVYALIRGSAVNQDGFSNGITAPNPLAQEAVLRAAYRNALVSPGLVQYVEAHGTGTKLGDPIEMKALGAVLAEGRAPGDRCAVGSVKTNIGHLEAAAGVAGLIKAALSLANRQIPPSLHFRTPNPYIPFESIPLRVQETLGPWPDRPGPAIAGVSSFGFGGTNAHVVLSEAPGARTWPAARNGCCSHVLGLSAKSEAALKQLAARYVHYLREHPELRVEDVCYTANAGRSHFKSRLAVVGDSTHELVSGLEAAAASRPDPGVILGEARSRRRPKVAFLFSGQGTEHVSLGRRLFLAEPVFRGVQERCAEILRPWMDTPPLAVWQEEGLETGGGRLATSAAALFSLEYGIAEMWSSWGVSPDAVLGQGVGEYVAACVAGVFSLEDALALVARDPGIGAPEPEGTSWGPGLAWPATWSRPRIPLVSSLTGQLVDQEPADARHGTLGGPGGPGLAEALETLRRGGCEIFLEVGPGPSLRQSVDQDLPEGSGVWLPPRSLPRADGRSLALSLALMYARGVTSDFTGMDAPEMRRKVALPTYPFQRQTYWLASDARGQTSQGPVDAELT